MSLFAIQILLLLVWYLVPAAAHLSAWLIFAPSIVLAFYVVLLVLAAIIAASKPNPYLR